MLRYRGTMKWTAMMLPEHVKMLRDEFIEYDKVDKPTLDEHQLEEINSTILEAMVRLAPTFRRFQFHLRQSAIPNEPNNLKVKRKNKRIRDQKAAFYCYFSLLLPNLKTTQAD